MQGGWTPLHLAVQSGHAAVVKMLLERGAAFDKTHRVRSHVLFNPFMYICIPLFLCVSNICDYHLVECCLVI